MANSTTITPQGRTFKGAGGALTARVSNPPQPIVTPFSIVTPLQFPNKTGDTFKTTADVIEGVIDDFKNMILTNYGERLAKPDFGANLRSLLTERISQDDWDDKASSAIKSTTEKYMPAITIQSVNTSPLPSKNDGFARVNVSVIFAIPSLGVQDRRVNITLTNVS